MTIERSVDGVIDFCFEKLEEVDSSTELDFDKRLKMTNVMLDNIWKGGRLIMDQKKLMMKAPELAKSDAVILPLGTKGKKSLRAVGNDSK